MLTNRINVISGHARPTCPDYFFQSLEDWKKSRKSQCEWSVRLSHEYKKSKTTIFVTLTFDDAHLPKLHYNPELSWDCSCFDGERISEQLIRPLRQVDGYVFKYIFFPEYGSDKEYIDDSGRKRKATSRPHYHGLLFFDYFIDVEILKQRIHYYWDSCSYQCMPVLQITSDDGFTRYVSKYVSKGIELKHFPEKCLSHVKWCRETISNARKMTSFTDLEKYWLQHSVHFLHWYETHRPKILCSRGIGKHEYTDEEYLNGSFKMFNGAKFVDTPIPSYNLRNHYYDKGEDNNLRYFSVKDGLVTFVPDSETYKLQTWSLNDDGRTALKHQIRKRFENFKIDLVRVLNLHGPISFDNIQRFNSNLEIDTLPLEYGTKYEDIVTLISGLAQKLGDEYVNKLACYKYLLSRYSPTRFSEITGLLPEQYSSIHKNWLDIYDFIVDMNSLYIGYSDNRMKKDSFDSDNDFQDIIHCLDMFDLLLDFDVYDKYLERKRDYENQKEHNQIKYKTFL